MAEFNRSTQNWCVGCMGAKEKTGFIQSLNPYHNTYLPLCRGCLNNRFKQYQKALNSEGAALWCLCAEMGYPVIKEYYDIALSRKTNMPNSSNLFMVYHNTLKELGFIIEGFWQSDLDLSDFAKTGQKVQKAEEKPLDITEMEKIWGKFEVEDYELLNGFFDAYTKEVDNLNYSLELRYRDVAKGELRLRKANESGDVGEIDKAQKNLKSLLDMLGLNDYGKKDTDERKQFIDRLAWMIEETEPAEEEDEKKYRDIAGFEKAFNNIMRSMRNLNSKVRVYPPVPEEEQ
nr:MAG TPA: hypothetical protein [Caudoviricetes sp.]